VNPKNTLDLLETTLPALDKFNLSVYLLLLISGLELVSIYSSTNKMGLLISAFI